MFTQRLNRFICDTQQYEDLAPAGLLFFSDGYISWVCVCWFTAFLTGKILIWEFWWFSRVLLCKVSSPEQMMVIDDFLRFTANNRLYYLVISTSCVDRMTTNSLDLISGQCIYLVFFFLIFRFCNCILASEKLYFKIVRVYFILNENMLYWQI